MISMLKGNRFHNLFAFLTPISPAFALVYYGILTARFKDVIQGLKNDGFTRYSLLSISAVGVVSALISQDANVSLLNSLVIPIFIGIYALGRWGIAYPREFLKALTLGAGLLGIVVMLGWLFKTDIWLGSIPILTNFDGRGNVLGMGDNGLAAMLEVGVTGGLGFFLYQSRHRWLYLIASISALSAILITLSRGSMVGTFAAVSLLLVLNSALVKKHWKIILILGIILLIVLVKSPLLSERVMSIFDLEQKNADRFEIWSTTIQMVKDHVLLGVGPGQYGEVYREYLRPDPICSNVRSPHSLYLYILSGWGIIGFIVFMIWAVGSVVLPVVKNPSPYRKIALAMVVSFFVHVVFNDLFVAHVPLIMGAISRAELDD